MSDAPACPECGCRVEVVEQDVPGLYRCTKLLGGCGHMWRPDLAEPEPEPDEPDRAGQRRAWRDAEGVR